tara:strand:- start:452 stop:1663 length:1212 start_codon:yes stop_codon:yes gene_type:complete
MYLLTLLKTNNLNPDDLFYKCNAINIAEKLNFTYLLPSKISALSDYCYSYIEDYGFNSGPGLPIIWNFSWLLKSEWLANIAFPLLVSLISISYCLRILRLLKLENKSLILSIYAGSPLVIWLSSHASTDIYSTFFSTIIFYELAKYFIHLNKSKVSKTSTTFLKCNLLIVMMLLFRPMYFLTLFLSIPISSITKNNLLKITPFLITLICYLLFYRNYASSPLDYLFYNFSPPAPEGLYSFMKFYKLNFINSFFSGELLNFLKSFFILIFSGILSTVYGLISFSGLQISDTFQTFELKTTAAIYKSIFGLIFLLPGNIIILTKGIFYTFKFLLKRKFNFINTLEFSNSTKRDDILNMFYLISFFYILTIVIYIPHMRYILPIQLFSIIASLNFYKITIKDKTTT